MQLDIEINNFGKISHAKIKVRPFTVIAGKNSSGKSFVTKSLYSFFNTINTDYVTVKVYNHLNELKVVSRYLTLLLPNVNQKEQQYISELLNNVDNLQKIADKLFTLNGFSNQLSDFYLLKENVLNLEVSLKYLSEKQEINPIIGIFEQLESHIDKLKNIFLSPRICLIQGIQDSLINSLKENFQISSLNELKNYHLEDETISFNFSELGKVNIKDENLSFDLDTGNIDVIQKLHNVVYLESPVYWKLNDALRRSQENRTSLSLGRYDKAELLTGVPQYFYDLRALLDEQRKTASEFEPLSNELNNKIGGEIIISNLGELSFLEKGSKNSISLHNTALGVTNLGIISLLLKKGVLSKGSFLFIDEPEVHLHPMWQKTLIETLYELSKNGVNIVIASHSIDMMKCVENIMERLPENELNDHFGINQLNINGESVENSSYPLRQISAIKVDLGESFSEMVMNTHQAWDDE